MKITGLEVWIFEPRPNNSQEVPEFKSSSTTQLGVARVFTDEGIEGVVSWDASTLRELARRWGSAREFFSIEGEDPFDRAMIDRVLRRRFGWSTALRGILDIALWDIAGKTAGKPIYKLLGAAREKVPAYGSTVHLGTDQRFVDVALECQRKGYQAVKIHPYCVAKDDIRICRLVRKAVGDDFTLMFDSLAYPGRYNREEAMMVGRVLDELNFYWFEDPLEYTDLDGLAELTDACKVVQIRMGDRIQDITQYPEMIRRHCMDIMAGPLTFGITDLMKLAALAEANHMKLEPHNYSGYARSLHVLLATHNTGYYEEAVPEGCLDTAIYPRVFKEPGIKVDSEGYVHAPTNPGLGYEIDLEEAKKVTIEKLKP